MQGVLVIMVYKALFAVMMVYNAECASDDGTQYIVCCDDITQ